MKNKKNSLDLSPWLALRFLCPCWKVAKRDHAYTSTLIRFASLCLDSFTGFDSQPLIYDPRHGQTAQVAKCFGYRFAIEIGGSEVSLSNSPTLIDTTLQRTNKLPLENPNVPDAIMKLVGPIPCFLRHLRVGRGGICAIRSHMMGPE